jgi:Glycosyl hydrolases family 16
LYSYLNATGAAASNLTFATDTSAIIRVDSTTRNTSTGRDSIRIESVSTYDNGLFIFDILHSPFGCGTWPALWLTDGYNWPTNGEIDVLEATNIAIQGNAMTLHTTQGCTMNVKRNQEGRSLDTDCHNATDNNAGCSVQGEPITYGPDFNAIGGGVRTESPTSQ